MHKYMIIGFLILFTLISSPLHSEAHSSLQGTSPQDGEVVKRPLDIITFKFSTDIRQGSKFTVTDQDGESIGIESIDIQDDAMLGQLSESLQTGTYTVNYEIISEDTHVVDGEFTFTVETGDSEEPAAEPEDKDESQEGQPDGEQQTDEESAGGTEQGEVQDGLSPVVIGISFAALLAGIAVIWWLLRKKATE